MKRYFIKETSRATENNPNFAGAISIGYYGKGDVLVANADREHPDRYSETTAIIFEDIPSVWMKEYGYARECDARRNWTFNNPENTEFWQSEVEIIAVEV